MLLVLVLDIFKRKNEADKACASIKHHSVVALQTTETSALLVSMLTDLTFDPSIKFRM